MKYICHTTAVFDVTVFVDAESAEKAQDEASRRIQNFWIQSNGVQVEWPAGTRGGPMFEAELEDGENI